MDVTKSEIAQRFQALHEEAGEPSYGEIQRYLTKRLGVMLAPTTTTVFRWHRDGVPLRGAPVTQLRVLCEFYSRALLRPITMADIHPELAEQWTTTREIAATSRYARRIEPGQQVLFDAAA